MGIFDRFRRQKIELSYAPVMNGYTPIFSQFGTDIYASDVVQQAVACIAQEMSKLRPMHIRRGSGDIQRPDANLQRVLNNPNRRMTKSEFIEKMTWLLFLNYNAFAIPIYAYWKDAQGIERRRLKEIYPINPQQVTFLEDASGEPFVQLDFANGNSYTVSYKDIIHIKHRYAVNEYMGGDENGQPNNVPLLKVLQMNKNLLDSVAKSINASMSVNGVIKYNTIMDKGKTQAAIKELEENLASGKSGFLPLDLSAEFIPINKNGQIVDSSILDFIDKKILRHFGVPRCILEGEYTKEQYEAFYQATLEPLVLEFGEAFTKGLFTQGEIDHGNEIAFYPKELIFMSVQQTLEMVTLLSNMGALYQNEARTAFGLEPLAELEGIRMMSLNWINAEDAQAYQVGGANNGKDDKNL